MTLGHPPGAQVGNTHTPLFALHSQALCILLSLGCGFFFVFIVPLCIHVPQTCPLNLQWEGRIFDPH